MCERRTSATFFLMFALAVACCGGCAGDRNSDDDASASSDSVTGADGGRAETRTDILDAITPEVILIDTYAEADVGSADLPVILDASYTDIPNTPPVVRIVSPQAGDTVFGTAEIVVEVEDDRGVSVVDLVVDGTFDLGTLEGPPFVWHWDVRRLDSRRYDIRVVATDTRGLRGTDVVSVDVRGDCDDENPCTEDVWVSVEECDYNPRNDVLCEAGICLGGRCCTPQCAERECGPDGCGGVCGECERASGLCIVRGCNYDTGVCEDSTRFSAVSETYQESYAGLEVLDGGRLATGAREGDYVYVVEFAKDGNIEESFQVPGSYRKTVQDIARSGDVYGVIMRERSELNLVARDGSSLPAVRLSDAYDGPGDISLSQVATAYPSGWVLTGTTSYNQSRAIVARVYESGDIAWVRSVIAGGFSHADAKGVAALPDGSFVVCLNEHFTDGTNEPQLVRIHANGDTDWAVPYHGVYNSAPRDYTFLNAVVSRPGLSPWDNARFDVVGSLSVGWSSAMVWLQTDASGNYVTDRIYSSQIGTERWGVDLTRAADGGVVMVGAHSGGSGGDMDVYLTKEGEWELTFGTDDDDFAHSVAATDEEFFVIAGSSGGMAALWYVDAAGRLCATEE